MAYDYLIVGAGLSGCVLAERIASQLNMKVLIIEKREHIGGNCYDYYNDDGILLHKYGPHWFHTNDLSIVAYLSRFTQWHMHDHRVRSFVNGKLYPIPINIDTVNELYHLNFTTEKEVTDFFDSVRVKEITVPRNAEEMIISQVGIDLYEKFYKHYTIKQWNIDPKDLPPGITARIPIRTSKDDRYFNDEFQALPFPSYSDMFAKIISHKNVDILLNTPFESVRHKINFRKLIYTGPIDEFFDYSFGKLTYRSVRFVHETIDQEYFQGYQQVNYPNDHAFTRIVEWKRATGQKHRKTTITREYPCEADEVNEGFYPVVTKENKNILAKYQNLLDRQENVILCGRLADYKYYNMDQVIARALHIFRSKILAINLQFNNHR